jgi:hypothetical protein
VVEQAISDGERERLRQMLSTGCPMPPAAAQRRSGAAAQRHEAQTAGYRADRPM